MAAPGDTRQAVDASRESNTHAGNTPSSTMLFNNLQRAIMLLNIPQRTYLGVVYKAVPSPTQKLF